jgi:L-rhamnose mutarotase
MKRVAFKMYLKPNCIEEYIRRHDELWPEIKQLLADEGVCDYSIFLDKEKNELFAVQKINGEGSSQDLGSNPINQRWWDYMADISVTNPDNSPVTQVLDEVFHLD